MERKETARMLVALFLAANLLGIVTAIELRSFEAVQAAAATNQSPETGVWFFLLVGLATVLLLALYRFNAKLLVKLWFGSAIFMTTLILVTTFIPPIPGIIITVILVILRYRVDDILLRNLFDMLAFAGAGALFGSVLGVQPAFILLVLLAGYDYASVFLTRHMITLAKEGAASDTFMGFTYPAAEEDGVAPEDIDMDAPTDDISSPDAVKVGMLGGGDVIIPMIFAITLLQYSVFATLSAVTGAAISLYLLLTRSAPHKFYPAIPVLATGLLSGFILWFIVASALL